MLIQSIKFNRKLAVGVLLIVALLLAALILLAGSEAVSDSGGRLHSTEDRVSYLAQLGWEVNPDSETMQEIVLPQSFNEVMQNYNQLQLQQGFDLSEYRGMTCTLYTYTLLSYPNATADVEACLYIYKGRVIGGDIHAAALDGFMHGLL